MRSRRERMLSTPQPHRAVALWGAVERRRSRARTVGAETVMKCSGCKEQRAVPASAKGRKPSKFASLDAQRFSFQPCYLGRCPLVAVRAMVEPIDLDALSEISAMMSARSKKP